MHFLAAAFCSLALGGESTAEHQVRMEAAQDTQYELRDAIDSKSSAKAIDANQKLIEFAAAEKKYWGTWKDIDGIKLAEATRLASEQMTGRLHASDWAGVEPAYANLQKTCRACHDAHLEKRQAK